MSRSTRGSTPSYRDDDVVIGEGVALAVPSASLMARAGGALLDGIVYVGSMVASLIAVFWFITRFAVEQPIEDAWLPVVLITWAVLWLVIIPMAIEVATQGRSLGKLVFGLRVVRLDGGEIAFRHAFVRALVGFGETYLSGGAISACCGLFTTRAQRFGDLLAGTYAQLERVPQPSPLQLHLPASLYAWAQIADVTRIPDVVARRVHEFFLQAHHLTPQARTQVAGELARACRPYVHPIPDVDAETFLTGVSVVRRDREYSSARNRAERTQRLITSSTTVTGFPVR